MENKEYLFVLIVCLCFYAILG